MPTEDAYSSGHLVLSHLGFANVLLLRPLTLNHTLHLFMTPVPDLTFTDFDVITEYRFPKGICNGCGMPTGDAYSSGHLVLSHFGTCMCSNVETNLSWTCLVSGLLNFEHPSVLLFCLVKQLVVSQWFPLSNRAGRADLERLTHCYFSLVLLSCRC